MHITFYGAVREVTGSMHLLTTESDRISLDCGMFQGRRKESREKNRVFPIDPKIITNVVLSHAHIDHSGRIPLLTRNHFNGRIICTRATADAAEYLLLDSAHIQESDAKYLNYKLVRSSLSQMRQFPNKTEISKPELEDIKRILKKDRNELNTGVIDDLIQTYQLDGVTPLYTVADAEASLKQFDGYPYRHPVTIGKNITCTFYEAGHILGSAISMIQTQRNGKMVTICYTGDIGRFDKPIIRNPNLQFPDAAKDIDLLIMESTYGNREHEPVKDLKSQLKDVILETTGRNGCIVIPSFAFGRTQELVYMLHELYNDGDVPKIPIYVDSPLAVKLTQVFGEHPEVYRQEAHETFLQKGENPFHFKNIRFITSVEDSMNLMRDQTPHIVIASSGMCEAGRILHHLRYKIHNPNNTILIVGYMAKHTLGRRILDQGLAYESGGRKGPEPIMRILNKEYPLKAKVQKIGGFSAHGDKNEMLRFLKESDLRIKTIAVVHGEEDQSLSFAETLRQAGYTAFVPTTGESFQVSV